MAGARPGVHIVQLKRVKVLQELIEGDKFIKWDEESGTGNPVTLKVDDNGFYLYWTNQNKEVDVLDIAAVRDTRNGKGAKVPKDLKLRQLVTMGSQDTLEEKTVTVVYGMDFVNVGFINFCCTKKETAQLWARELLSIAYNLLQLNSSVLTFLRKIHTKLRICTDRQGKIPIKNIVKTFAQNKEDRKRVEKALDAAGLPSGKTGAVAALPKPVEKLTKAAIQLHDTLNPSRFGFEEFFQFYKHMVGRSEVERVFEDIVGSTKKKLMSAEQFMDFINKEQRDPRLNEILYPYTTPEKAKELIEFYEPNQFNRGKGLLSFEGFLRYLISEDNSIISMEKLDLSDDMDQPLSHYFINSSHNTYLTGHQLTGKSSVEMYRQSLLAGCRCVELDFWNGKFDREPHVLHGYTLVPEIPAKDVFEAIAESAFKTSEYPVILSFENHCNTKQQAKIAQYCREIFGSMLLDQPLDEYPLESGVPLPPPSFLKRKIIIKNKKKHHHHHKQKPVKKSGKVGETENGETVHLLTKEDSKDSVDGDDGVNVAVDDEDGLSSSSDEEDDSTEPDDLKSLDKSQSDKGTAGKESEAGAEISALVNYVQPVHFYSFESSCTRKKYYEMSSFDEKQAMTLLKEHPVEFVDYNKHQLSRVYPRGTRVDSSNFMPQLFWNAGCQLVALNYQTLDLAMQLNLGIFECNKRSGYLLKPEFMRRKDRKFDPFAESTVDGIVAGTVSIKVISGQFLSDKRIGTYVEVEMYGLPTDTVRKKFRTKTIMGNGINPVYDEDVFVFKKVVLPDLACIRIAASEESGRFIGHRVLPVKGIRPGFRHVTLRNEASQSLNLPTVFVNVQVRDYVPDGLAELADALANPIKYQNELEKRAKQLSVLQDDNFAEDSSLHEDSDTVPPAPNAIPITNTTVPTATTPNPNPKTFMSSWNASFRRKAAEPTPSDVSSSPPSATSPSNFGAQGKTATTDAIDDGKKSALGPMPPPPPTLAAFVSNPAESSTSAAFTFCAEPIDKFWENKTVKDKKQQLEKKLEELRRRHEKDRKVQKPTKKTHQKLVKKLSAKNLEAMMLKKETCPPSEALFREQIAIEKDLVEKGQEEIFKIIEKQIKESQSKQIKLLNTLEEKEINEVMKWVYNWKKDEYRRLSKLTRDKNELDRMKREVNTALVDKGVVEREKKAKIYSKIRSQLEIAHQDIFKAFEETKSKTFAQIEEEFTALGENPSVSLDETSNASSDKLETFRDPSFQV